MWMLTALLGAPALGQTGSPPPREAERPTPWRDAVDRQLGRWVSPGRLAKAHAEWEVASGCTECHAGLSETPDDRCLACHELVAERIQAETGWHGQLTGTCQSCHAEHLGRDADLRGLDLDAFNHEQAAFPLRGGHQDPQCESCHLQEPEGGGEPRLQMLGLAFETCSTCHESPHPEAFGPSDADCSACHTEASFDTAGLTADGFDHSRDSGFELTGVHTRVPCGDCHTPARRLAAEAKKRAPGKDAPQDCVGCHDDPHAGNLKLECGGCHEPTLWSGASVSFEHSRDTSFPLDLAHADLDCSTCHEDLGFASSSVECAGCHPDAERLLVGEGFFGAQRVADVHADRVTCEECHPASRAAPRRVDHARVCGSCHPAEYEALALDGGRILDGLVVKVEARLRTLELARESLETPNGPDAERTEQIRTIAARLARTGLHNLVVSEATLLNALDTLRAPDGKEATR